MVAAAVGLVAEDKIDAEIAERVWQRGKGCECQPLRPPIELDRERSPSAEVAKMTVIR